VHLRNSGPRASPGSFLCAQLRAFSPA
jgi:hypothetical protein